MKTVYTIGYEGTDIEQFVQTLKIVGVKILADVRAVALSRKKGFSKNSLKARLESEGIEYLHFMALGDPKPGREAARAGKFDLFRKIYTKHLSGEVAQDSLDALMKTAESGPTCLLCFERDPIVCHRSIVAQKLSVFGMDVFDLYGDSASRYVNFPSKLPRFNSSEGVAAA
jgi:uncharacterized protein (DUF488 family)